MSKASALSLSHSLGSKFWKFGEFLSLFCLCLGQHSGVFRGYSQLLFQVLSVLKGLGRRQCKAGIDTKPPGGKTVLRSRAPSLFSLSGCFQSFPYYRLYHWHQEKQNNVDLSPGQHILIPKAGNDKNLQK